MEFEKERSPNFKYESRLAVALYRWILGGGTFESYDGEIRPGVFVNRQTKFNWYKTIPEFANARHLAEEHKQGNVDRAMYALAMGTQLQKVDGMDQSKMNPQVLMFLAKTIFRKTYSEKTETILSNPDGSPLGSPVDYSNLNDEELEAMIKLTRKAQRVETADS